MSPANSGVLTAVEAALWISLVVAFLVALVGLRRDARFGAGVFLLALLLREIVPHVPLNWYMGVANLPLAAQVFSRPTTTLPLPNRLLMLNLGLGFNGVVAVNILCGALCAPLAWDAARTAGYSEPRARALALLIAVVPVYVRVAASDAAHGVSLMLWLVAASALARAVKGRHAALVPLAAATLLGCPIRIEATLMFPAVPFFVGGAPGGFQRIRSHADSLCVFLGALAIGCGASWWFLHSSWSYRIAGSFNLAAVVSAVALRTVLLVNPIPQYYLPIPVVAAGWYAIVFMVKRRQWSRLAAMLGPISLFSIPFAVHAPVFSNLPAAAYHVIFLVLVLVPCAEGCVMAAGALRAWLPRLPAPTRLAVGGAGVLASLGCLVPVYSCTYVHQEEHRFLRRHLPREGPARVLAIFDPKCGTQDADTSLALPYATLAADYPDLTWTVLTTKDLANEKLWNTLQFDYYYAGPLVILPPESVGEWPVARLAREYFPFIVPELAEEQRIQKEYLRSISALDRRVRERFALKPVAEVIAPARTFGGIKFPTERATLTLYRRDVR